MFSELLVPALSVGANLNAKRKGVRVVCLFVSISFTVLSSQRDMDYRNSKRQKKPIWVPRTGVWVRARVTVWVIYLRVKGLCLINATKYFHKSLDLK
jgi:hypothetical protein